MKKLNIHIKRQLLTEKAMSKLNDITNRIKTFEDACSEIGINVVCFPEYISKFTIAVTKLEIIIKALNEGWKPNYNDSNEQKWYPWFNYTGGSGFVFDATGCDYANANATVGARLCFKTKTLATYAGKQFIAIYNDYLM